MQQNCYCRIRGHVTETHEYTPVGSPTKSPMMKPTEPGYYYCDDAGNLVKVHTDPALVVLATASAPPATDAYYTHK